VVVVPESSNDFKGFVGSEKIAASMDTMPLDQRAAYGAVLRARAAAMPRMMLEYNRVAAERDAMKEELEKYRGTDPGATGKNGVQAPSNDKPKGINDFAAVFDQS